MTKFAYEMNGPAAANGWQAGGHDPHLSTAVAAWHALAEIVQRSDPGFAASLRERTTAGTVDHDDTQYKVTRTA